MASKTSISRSAVVGSSPSAISGTCKDILSELKVKHFSKDDEFAVHLAIEEAFSNAVKHGNKMDPNKEVKIDYSVSTDKIEITMTDEGEGFDPNAVPDPRYGENLYKPYGRGLLLMRCYMNIVEFNERGNGEHMVRYKDKSPVTKETK